MGYALTWAAIKGATPEQVHEVLSLQGTGTRTEIAETGLTGATLPDGWYLVTSDHAPLNLTDKELLAKLSQFGDVIVCDVEEHCMASFSAQWKNGKQLWSLMHDAQSRIDRLDVEGEPPPSFAEIRDRLQAEQIAAKARKERVDYIFDIPVEVASSITGYRHDYALPDDWEVTFEALISTRPERRPWWKKLLRT
jgi:hypothetical protein